MHDHADARPKVDYDRLATSYDRRYAGDFAPGVGEALADISSQLGARRALEAGCGTAYWLAGLPGSTVLRCGLDLSAGMLSKALARDPRLQLAQGRASRLPFSAGSFDLVYCINALHHFHRPEAFLHEARRILRPGGGLVVVGLDPRRFLYSDQRGSAQSAWYIYEYFPGTLETDLERYPSVGVILDWLVAAGFSQATWHPVALVRETLLGEAILDDPFLQQEATSQLTLLSESAYKAGLARIQQALSESAAAGEEIGFAVDLILEMIIALI